MFQVNMSSVVVESGTWNRSIWLRLSEMRKAGRCTSEIHILGLRRRGGPIPLLTPNLIWNYSVLCKLSTLGPHSLCYHVWLESLKPLSPKSLTFRCGGGPSVGRNLPHIHIYPEGRTLLPLLKNHGCSKCCNLIG